MDDIYYMVVHYNGGLTQAEMQWFDEDDYKLASNKKFETESAAINYGKQLARMNGLTWEGDDGILDE